MEFKQGSWSAIEWGSALTVPENLASFIGRTVLHIMRFRHTPIQAWLEGTDPLDQWMT